MRVVQVFGLVAALVGASPLDERAKQPKSFLKQVGNATWVLGNDLWNVTQNRQYANQLWYKGEDRVGQAVGHYVSYNGAASDLNWTSASISSSGTDWIDIKFTAREGDFHWVLHDDLPGAYQYFVNHALPTLGEFRTLWRLSNTSFPSGRTNVKNGILPPLADYLAATNVQDETWQKADGTYLTKYDWAGNVRDMDFHGVYGEDVGSWYIHGGKDYFNGDATKQELMVHRESKTGDAVQLNMIHGTHFQAVSHDTFADNRTWGPWLWYLNDGSLSDAAARVKQEQSQWPYKWFTTDKAFQARGKLQGRILLSDGRPAANAAIFLGDNKSNLSTLDQGANYYYTTSADASGKFSISDIRSGTYTLSARADGAPLADVLTTFSTSDISIRAGDTTNLKDLSWIVPDSKKSRIFTLGACDRRTDGFNLSNPHTPFEHARISKCPANLTYNIDTSKTEDWCFGQAALGTWSILFNAPTTNSSATYHAPSLSTASSTAKLTLSLAGFSQGSTARVLVNNVVVGSINSSLANSQDTYRGATRSGEWRLLEFAVGKGVLKEGVENRVDVVVDKAAQWRGWLWDCVVAEWV